MNDILYIVIIEVTELLGQYEVSIHEKQNELNVLRAQRDELKQVEEMLQNLQVSVVICMSCDQFIN